MSINVTRPAIPAEVRRAVLTESGHRCAIPACQHVDVDLHHIIPWEECKKHDYSNLIALCPNCHRMAHRGKIDRKSLLIYKDLLISALRNLEKSIFKYPVVEAKRKIYSVDFESSERYFDFEFPDFFHADYVIASKNIEAWGLELLGFHQDQITELDLDTELSDWQRSTFLLGRYEVVRRDISVLSIKYTIDSIFPGAAHGYRDTRVQNFLISPFVPLTIEELVLPEQSLLGLSELVVGVILEENPDFDPQWVKSGVPPTLETFSCFVIKNYSIDFIFSEYSVACYAAGTITASIPFSRLKGIVQPHLFPVFENGPR